MQTAKLFVNGRSQAVRLPKDYQFDTNICMQLRINLKVY